MLRMSSPGSYSRTSSKSRPEPRKTLRYVPRSAWSARMRALISTCFTTRRTSGGIARREHETHDVVLHGLVHVDLAHGLPRLEDRRRRRELSRQHRVLDRVPIHDQALFVLRRIADDHFHHEPVDLRLR